MKFKQQASAQSGPRYALRISFAAILMMVVVAESPEPADGAVTFFNESANSPGDPASSAAAETAYLAAIPGAGYTAFTEGFSASAFDPGRIYPSTAVSLTNQGITWHSSTGDYLGLSDAGGGASPWLIYSKGGSPQESLHAVPATIFGESTRTLYGIGMWVNGNKGKLNLILDDGAPMKFVMITGYDTHDPPEPFKSTIGLSNTPQFFGVIVPDGFTKFQLLEIDGTLEDQAQMWASNFTFAVPEPATMSLLALGGIALLRRRRNRG
jgi:hypothetical protein